MCVGPLRFKRRQYLLVTADRPSRLLRPLRGGRTRTIHTERMSSAAYVEPYQFVRCGSAGLGEERKRSDTYV